MAAIYQQAKNHHHHANLGLHTEQLEELSMTGLGLEELNLHEDLEYYSQPTYQKSSAASKRAQLWSEISADQT